jgi:hypothetical protein
MHADLDTLCAVVYCTADDFLPEKPGNARRRVTDVEIATLCVARAIMGIPSDRRFLAVARKRLRDPRAAPTARFHKRRARLAETIEWLIGVRHAEPRLGRGPAAHRLDSFWSALDPWRRHAARLWPTPPDYGWRGSHSRFFWGFRLHGLFAPDGTPRTFTLVSPKRDEREVGIELLGARQQGGGEIVLGDKGYAGREFAAAVGRLAQVVKGVGAVALEGEGVLASPKDRLDPLADRCEVKAGSRLVLSSGAHDRGARSHRPALSRLSTTGSGIRVALCSTTSPEGVESTIRSREGRFPRALIDAREKSSSAICGEIVLSPL